MGREAGTMHAKGREASESSMRSGGGGGGFRPGIVHQKLVASRVRAMNLNQREQRNFKAMRAIDSRPCRFVMVPIRYCHSDGGMPRTHWYHVCRM